MLIGSLFVLPPISDQRLPTVGEWISWGRKTKVEGTSGGWTSMVAAKFLPLSLYFVYSRKFMTILLNPFHQFIKDSLSKKFNFNVVCFNNLLYHNGTIIETNWEDIQSTWTLTTTLGGLKNWHMDRCGKLNVSQKHKLSLYMTKFRAVRRILW